METVRQQTKTMNSPPLLIGKKESFWKRLGKDLKRNKYIYIMVFPVVLYYLIFHYGPMYGVQIAFKDYNITEGIWSSRWIGLDYFMEFF